MPCQGKTSAIIRKRKARIVTSFYPNTEHRTPNTEHRTPNTEVSPHRYHITPPLQLMSCPVMLAESSEARNNASDAASSVPAPLSP